MHYPKVAFPIAARTVTIQPIEPGVKIGQRVDMSPSDVLDVKRVYQCPSKLLFQTKRMQTLIIYTWFAKKLFFRKNQLKKAKSDFLQRVPVLGYSNQKKLKTA